MIVNVLLWCLFGLIAGAIAQFLMPGRDPGGSGGMKGMAITILIGIVGAALGGFLCHTLLKWDVSTGFNLESLAVAIAGAIVLLILYRFVMSAVRKS